MWIKCTEAAAPHRVILVNADHIVTIAPGTAPPDSRIVADTRPAAVANRYAHSGSPDHQCSGNAEPARKAAFQILAIVIGP